MLYPASRAEKVATSLNRTHGPAALGRAQHRRDHARASGKSRQADLYCAVCTIIADRDQVFSRSRVGGVRLAD